MEIKKVINTSDRRRQHLLVIGATCVLTFIIWCGIGYALDLNKNVQNFQHVDDPNKIANDSNSVDDFYPDTPEGVISEFIKSNHSVKAMKQFYLYCEGIDCEGEIPPEHRFMSLFDYDLDPCTTDGLKKITSRIMSSHRTGTTKTEGDKAQVNVHYIVKGILKIACVPTAYISYGLHEKWEIIATYDLTRVNGKWKISNLSIDDGPPLPKSKEWAINKLAGMIAFYKNNIEFGNKTKACMDAIVADKKCLIQTR